MVESNGDYAFKRIVFSLVRDGTRLKTAIEGCDEGCFLTMPDYVREVLDGKRQSGFGVWIRNRDRLRS